MSHLGAERVDSDPPHGSPVGKKTVAKIMQHLLQQGSSYVLRGVMRVFSRLRPFGKATATVAINVYPAFGPWGGSSVFVKQFVSALRRCGFKAVFDLRNQVDAICLIDPRDDLQKKAFGLEDIKRYKDRYPSVKVIHRINECDKRKGTAFMDDLLQDTNSFADHTVFISSWLRDYFIKHWFDPNKPHCVIYNGADPEIFHPIGSALYKAGQTMRIVTHHWSDNPMKGFPVYEKLDNLIADGDLEGFEFWVIGRWPETIKWRSAKIFPPASGDKLASLLRKCHLYITASLWEPCGMHHVEGAQCGLPLIYHADGGGIVEAGAKYGMEYRDNLKDVLLEAREKYSLLRQKVLQNMPSGDRMCFEYFRIIQQLLAERNF